MTRPSIPARVVSKERVATEIWSFRFEVAADAFVAAEAGSHVDVELPSGLIRQYSLVHVPHGSIYQIAVLREEGGRGGSRELCDQVGVGDTLGISAPRNNFALESGKARYLLIAGGIGLTPLFAMAETLHERQADFELHICATSPAKVAFLSEIEVAPWVQRVHLHYSAGDPPSPLDIRALLCASHSDTQIYVCGPKRMLAAVDEATRGWPPGRVRTEHFAATATVAGDDENGCFEVLAARSGKRFTVEPGVSLLDALLANDIAVESSCREGTCGSCVTPVIAGELIHRDSCLYEDERVSGKTMAVCVSRAKPGTELVLDI
jgi:ferredoxin-NADP reductase